MSALLHTGSAVHLGGSFKIVVGEPRNGIAAVEAGSAALLGWNPGLFRPDHGARDSPDPEAVHTAGGFGTFATFGDEKRYGFAAFDRGAAALLPLHADVG